MNSLSRVIPPTKHRILLRPLQLLHSHYATKPKTPTTDEPKTIKTRQQPPQRKKTDFPRQTEVHFQPKVENSVQLVGCVKTPLQLHTAPDGTFWAATLLTTQSLQMPIIFEGELAHTASLHVKESDCVFVAGNFRSDLNHLNACEGQTDGQVKVHTLHFVEQPKNRRKERTVTATGKEDMTSESPLVSEDVKYLFVWKDILAKPHEWWVVRSKEDHRKAAAFERKSDGELRMIDDSTPEWIRQKLDSLTLDQKLTSDTCETTTRKNGNSTVGSWRDLLDNPKQWTDYRAKKLNGSVNPNHPDFKRKGDGPALWLNRAPQGVLSELENMNFDL